MALKKSELYSSLWSSCDELRGGMDASQYKDYVLVLLFIKYVSDKYAGLPYAPITIPAGASFKDMVALKGKSDIGGVVQFRFGAGGFDMKVLELDPAKRVLWEVVDGPEEWIGTNVSWDLKQDGDYTVILFKHQGWKEPVEFMNHCSTKWAVFLLSLKSLLETGQGTPDPNDVKIDNWN